MGGAEGTKLDLDFMDMERVSSRSIIVKRFDEIARNLMNGLILCSTFSFLRTENRRYK